MKHEGEGLLLREGATLLFLQAPLMQATYTETAEEPADTTGLLACLRNVDFRTPDQASNLQPGTILLVLLGKDLANAGK